MNRRVFVILTLLAASLCATTVARAASLTPTDDSFGYQFLPTFNMNAPPFGNFLPAGKTTTGHDTRSVLKFDLSTLGLTSAQVTSATLDLYVVSTESTTFGVSPSPGSPITVNLSALGAGAWTEGTVTNNTIPAVGAQYDSLVISGINQLVSFDVTQLVKDWLDNTVPNNGLILEGNVPVGSSPNWVYAVFSSKEFANGVDPVLNVVPEPTSVMLALVAVPALAWLARKRVRSKRSR